MNAHEFLTNLAIIGAAMALVAALESLVPMFARTPQQRGRGGANLGLTAVTFAANWAVTSAAAVIALILSLHGPRPLARLGVPLAAQIVFGVAVLDFSFGYLAHRAMHLSPLLWRVHRVHHSDPFVDVTTTYRTHPIESAWRFLFVIVPVWMLGLPPEAVVIHRLLSALNGLLEHANIRVWRPLESALSLVWVSPRLHKIHHSRVAVETDSNYGNILSLYDRALGTFTSAERARSVVYGLDDADPPPASLTGLLALPFHGA
jgi:sterol desaturase/sphingolipid hydroxylase (fatty acid hydroxylase superfamily)